MSINGIIPEENEFFEISMNPDESLPNSSLDFEIIQMEKARSNVNRLIVELVPGFHATEIPNDSCQSSNFDTESASSNTEVR